MRELRTPDQRLGGDVVTAARLLTAEQVAERWQIPTGHVYRLAREGRLPCVTLGRYRRFREADLEQFEASGGTNQRTTA